MSIIAKARFEFLEEDRDGKIWKIEALHVTTTKNKRYYSKEELQRGARSLSWRPLNINHNEDAMLPYPNNQTLETDFDATQNAVVGRMRIADHTVNRLIESGKINRLSVEQLPVYGETCDMTACEQHGVTFVGLALLTSDTTPGDGDTKIMAESVNATETKMQLLADCIEPTSTITFDPSVGTATTATSSNATFTISVEGADEARAELLKVAEAASTIKKECSCQLQEDTSELEQFILAKLKEINTTS